MADAAVGFLLSSVTELLSYHFTLITEARKEIEVLQNNLKVFSAFLRDSVEKRRNDDETTKEMVGNIREVVYQMEDIIDDFVAKNQDTSLVNKFKSPFSLHGIATRVQDLTGKVEQCRKNIGIAIAAVDPQNKSRKSQVRPPRKKDVVGFVDEADYLRRRLTADTTFFDVVSLVGMLGLGKTTLAWMIYNDPAIICKFPIRLWLPISQEFSDRDIFLAVLRQHTTITDDIRDKDDDELADMVFDLLNRGCFLIVFDDVWEKSHWDRLNRALPTSNHKGKILITTRNKDVANYASKPREIRELRLFYPEESWELLRQEAVRSKDCPPKLEALGRVIAGKCEGLPLAIVIIGGILAINFSLKYQTATEKEWELMPARVHTYLSDNDPEKRMKKLISLSYDKLPYHLRSCFLYLGIFPEDYEIRASKLYRLWIGEGFIQPMNEYFSLEETAEMYLSELINRNLVKSERFKHDGKVKTCRVHDTLRDFCRAEAEAENLLKEVKYIKGSFAPPVSEIDKYRRLSLHSNCLSFIPPKRSAPHVRSFVCFSKDDFHIKGKSSANIIPAFKYIKVFDVKPFKFENIDSYFYKLVYMKYIALSTNLETLHSRFNNFWNIQTLIVDTTSRTLEVEADIWNMRQLRCFKTNASAKLPNPTESSKYGKELQTLGTIAVESCTAELSSQACNLRKLGIRGKLASLFEERAGSFVSLRNFKFLEKLKLINDVHPYPASDMPLNGLPQPHQFPAALTSLTLCATYLQWCHMKTLGSLAKLEVLKLIDYAFVGDIWETADGGFESLQLLYIKSTDLAVWTASSHHFPRLRGLVLQKCEKLQEIPSELAKIPSLQMLDLLTCKSAAASAKKIKEEKKNTEAEGCAFMLSIFPAPNE